MAGGSAPARLELNLQQSRRIQLQSLKSSDKPAEVGLVTEAETDPYKPDFSALQNLDSAEAVLTEVKEKLRFLQSLLSAATNLEFAITEALDYWEKLREHRQRLTEELSEEVHLSTAFVDYFTRIHKLIKNPVVVDYRVLETLQEHANKDFLTGLYTRRFIQETLAKEVARAARQQYQFSLVLFDIDDFKLINDTYGHDKGDEVLKNVSATIQGLLRAQDFLCRYGGDELLCILPATDHFHALVMAERIRRGVADLGKPVDDFDVRLSYGVSTFPVDSQNADELIKACDKRLYLYKSRSLARSQIAQERRGYVRTQAFGNQAVLYAEGEKIPVDLLDLSYDGLSFKAKQAIETGLKCRVYLFLKPPFTPLLAEAETVHVQSLPEGGFKVGCRVRSYVQK